MAEKRGGKVESNVKKHIMVKDRLEKLGYNMWIDVEQMSDSTLTCMAKAVENSAIVLMCFSKAYRDSKSCKIEGEYICTKEKPFIPLLVESGYKADDWLGALLGTKLYIDFSQAKNFESKFAELVKAIERKLPAQKRVLSSTEAKSDSRSQNNVAQKMEKLTLRQNESDGTKQRSNAQRMKIDMISGKAKLLISKPDYDGAVSLLEDPCILESDDFLTKLMLAECYLQLGKEHKAINMISGVKRAIMTSSGLTPGDVKEYANGFLESESYVRAMILFRITSDMYEKSRSSPNIVFAGVQSCSLKTYHATKAMIKAGGRSRTIGIEFGIEFLREIHSRLKALKHTNPGNKAKSEAWSCYYIGVNLTLAGEKEKSIKINQTAVEILERQFGAEASKYRVYGFVMHDLGVSHFNLKQFSRAESYYLKAVEARENATDYTDKNGQEKDTETSKNSLKKTRERLAKSD